ncbi:MAG TPA: DUF3105 domain-containing protein [Candidatus Angelobacter sp.]|nr:DUF3105 domain-containing protein [Candidatus Angelobacter sp.]
MTRAATPSRLIVLAAVAALLAGCGSGSGGPATSGSPSTPSATEQPSGTPSATSASPTSPPPAALPSSADQIVPAAPSGAAVTTQSRPARVTPPAGIPGLLAWDTSGYPAPGAPGPGTLAHDHVDGPVVYAVTPPVGGPHAPIWMNAGVYTVPVPSERAVHDLEHGAVWITYDPSLPAGQVAVLTAFVARQSLLPESGGGLPPGQSNRYVVMSPWATSTLPSPIVISAWGYQLRVTSPTDPRLQRFVDTFRASATYSPEQGSPVDGVPTGTGGVAAGYGGSVPNPAGTVS